ncbi:heme d1 biosynthesis radical SAM protein NirJ [Aquifex pyrophilus]
MLRVSRYVRKALRKEVPKPINGVILIWNLTNRCNLYCKHCYASANQNKREELSLDEIKRISDELKEEGVRFVIISGGEPLLREDIYDIAKILKDKGFKTYLSTNGILIKEDNVKEIKESFDYVGISVDGNPEVHDLFRGKRGAFRESVRALELCLSEGIRTGLRFTLTELTKDSLDYVFTLVEDLEIPKIYISHIVFAGRGKRLGGVEKEEYKGVVKRILERALSYVEKGKEIEVVTGNNECDGVLLYKLFSERYPEYGEYLYEGLKNWGGNSAGERLVNIDHRGNVKPDPFFPLILGNLRERSFKEIWNSNGILSKLRERPRKLKGRCSECPYLEVCNGNSRARAYFAYGDLFEEDPLCYL